MRAPPRLVKTRPSTPPRARGLVSSRKSGRRIEAHTVAPPDDLRDVVETFWAGSWDLPADAPHVTEMLSDPCVNYVFEAGGKHAGSRVVGVWTRLWIRKLEGRGFVRGVKLRAGAARAFASEPAFRFRNSIAPLASTFGHEVRALEREVLGSDDEGAAFASFAEWLRSRRRSHEAPVAIALVDRIASDPEITTVERLAAVGGFGARALQRIFREDVGASPKWVIRRKRLQEVAFRIERGGHATLAAIAAELGYTDQAHLARDFKSAVGKSPSEFAASVHE
jgi:AraC-like DNA-binding protein